MARSYCAVTPEGDIAEASGAARSKVKTPEGDFTVSSCAVLPLCCLPASAAWQVEGEVVARSYFAVTPEGDVAEASGAARSRVVTPEGDFTVSSCAVLPLCCLPALAAGLLVSGGTAWTGRASIGTKGSCRAWVDSSTHDWTPSYRRRLKTPSLTSFFSDALLSCFLSPVVPAGAWAW